MLWMLLQNMIVLGNNFTMGGSAKAGTKGEALNDEIGLAMAMEVGLGGGLSTDESSVGFVKNF